MPDTQTWLCPAPPHSAGKLPILLYMLGPNGPKIAHDIFQLHHHDHVGSVYMVIDSDKPQPTAPFSGALGLRKCHFLLTKPRAPVGYIKGMRGHYSQEFVMEKLDLLASLPSSLQSVVLLDSDTFVTPAYSGLLLSELAQMDSRQFVAAARAEARTYITGPHGAPIANCTNEWCLNIPPASEGVNSGCLVLNLTRFRAWNAAFCDRGARPWYACALELSGRGSFLFQGGDNGVWNTLIAFHPYIWRPLPCGTHASVAVLRGLARTLSQRDGAAPLCDVSVPASRYWYEGRYLPATAPRGFPWGAYDQCIYPVEGADARFGPVPRAPAGGVAPAVLHGAARLTPLAALVATLWTTRSAAARARITSTYPCWCLSFVGHDDRQVGHELPAPSPTGCRKAASALANMSQADASPSSE